MNLKQYKGVYMKDFYTHINIKIYYTVVLIIMTLMIMGLVLDNPSFGKLEVGFILHSVLIIVLFTCLLLYPRYENHVS